MWLWLVVFWACLHSVLGALVVDGLSIWKFLGGSLFEGREGGRKIGMVNFNWLTWVEGTMERGCSRLEGSNDGKEE
jgi:hypothetical protein